MRIIDISNWKAEIDLNAVDCDGVVVQCTWGCGELTTQYGLVNGVWTGADEKIQTAAKRGLKVGYMHYIRGIATAEEEARWFVAQTEGYLHKYVPSVDWEADDNNAWGNRNYLDAWLTEYIRLTGVPPLVYCQRSEIPYVQDICAKHDCGLWEACYANMDRVGWQDDSTIWSYVAYPMRQYTSSGQITGYNGRLDLNWFNGDASTWDAYAHVDGSASTPTDAAPAVPTVLAGEYVVDVDRLNVRTSPSVNATIAAQYSHGEHVVLDGWGAYADGYVWGRYVGAQSGEYRYVAVGLADSSEWYLMLY